MVLCNYHKDIKRLNVYVDTVGLKNTVRVKEAKFMSKINLLRKGKNGN